MKRLMLALIVSILSASVAAEWTKVGETREFTTYLDLDHLRKEGNMRTVWELMDLKKQLRDARSFRAKVEFDCLGEQSRVLYMNVFSGPMASGEIVLTDDELGDFTPIPPDTAGWTKLEVVCSK